MRDLYLKQLEELGAQVFAMGQLVQEAIRGTASALHTLDYNRADEIIQSDALIDSKEKEIESSCLHLLLQQNPMAGDLRQVSAALKMITDLERIGDHAGDISEMILLLADDQDEKLMELIEQMAEITGKMVAESIDAYCKEDLEKAKHFTQVDDQVDRLFLLVKEMIAEGIVKQSEKATEALDLLMIAKYYERIGDHAENIAEWAVFSITGQHKEERVI